jgi:hypothetical protein
MRTFFLVSLVCVSLLCVSLAASADDWQFGLPPSDAVAVKARGLSITSSAPDWQFGLAPPSRMDYSAAYQKVVNEGSKPCLVGVGLTEDQKKIAKREADEHRLGFAVAGSLEGFGAGLYVLSKSPNGGGILVPYPSRSKPVPVMVCPNGRCNLVVGP